MTLFGALDQFYAALAKANYDFTKIDPSVEATLETPAVKAATDHVDAYIKNTCGIDTGAEPAEMIPLLLRRHLRRLRLRWQN